MTEKIILPDTGSNTPVEIIEIHVKKGDTVTEGQTLLTLESDKATIDVPSPAAGQITKLLVKVGDKVKTADLIGEMATADDSAKEQAMPTATLVESEKPVASAVDQVSPAPKQNLTPVVQNVSVSDVAAFTDDASIFAGPLVRRLARLLGVDLTQVKPSGERGRLTAEDVRNFVKQQLSVGSGAATNAGLPTMPEIDFAQFGPIEVVARNRIKQLTAQNLSRNWLLAPHVTQFAEADITELEAFRKQQLPIFAQSGLKLTPLVLILKALVSVLKEFPQMNASLDPQGNNLILKKYYHIGIAVDTSEGLVVPVIRDVDKKSLRELAQELDLLSAKAREQKLTGQDMQGSTFTVSSLGGIGGTAFTPIINLPNVAILGVSKSEMKPKYINETFQPRLMLPLSLSYDHRVMDGAEAARFAVTLTQYLADLRKCLL